jgi:hypothetical protein
VQATIQGKIGENAKTPKKLGVLQERWVIVKKTPKKLVIYCATPINLGDLQEKWVKHP